MKGTTKKIFEWMIAIIVALAIFLILSIFVGQGKISGSSMTPTYENGERVIMQKAFYNLEVGNVITFWAEKTGQSDEQESFISKIFNKDKELHVKRIVAVPGDKVEIKNTILGVEDVSSVYVNDELLMSSETEIVEEKEYQLEEDEYFVIGDNYDNSLDSRIHGPIKEEDIYSKVLFARDNQNYIDLEN